MHLPWEYNEGKPSSEDDKARRFGYDKVTQAMQQALAVQADASHLIALHRRLVFENL